MSKTLLTKNAKIWKDENDIVYGVITSKDKMTLDNAIENMDAIRSLFQGKKVNLLSDVRLIKQVDKDARDYSSSVDFIANNAIVVSSPLTKVLGNMFLAVTKPKFNGRLFTSESEAVTWLLEENNT